MRLLLSLIALQLGMVHGWAAIGAPLRQSDQFTVVDARPVSAFSPGQLKSASGEDLVRLDADTLLLSAERVRELLVSVIGLPSKGAGRIRFFLFTATKPDHVIPVVSSLTPHGWEYRLEIPDQLETRQLARALVHALLLEFANRGQGPKSAELPVWLVEGLTGHFLAVAGPDLVVGAVPIGKMFRSVRVREGLDYLEEARAVLRANRPISFAELSYPSAAVLAGQSLQVFQASAHLFVFELLRLKNGPAKLRTMLRQLPECWNWETALLHGFQADFQRVLDVEKKWSVDVLAFTASDPSQVWSELVSLNRLDELLSVQALVRTDADTLPEKKPMDLQQMIRSWDFAQQAPVLRQKLVLLETLRAHATTNVVPLVDDYRRTIASYLEKRAAAGRTPETRMQPVLSASWVAQKALQELDELDKRRDALRPEQALSRKSR